MCCYGPRARHGTSASRYDTTTDLERFPSLSELLGPRVYRRRKVVVDLTRRSGPRYRILPVGIR